MATYTTSRKATTATFADNGTLSDAVDLSGSDGAIVGIIVPTGWVTAALTFQASLDGVTWYEMVDTRGVVIGDGIVATATTWIPLVPTDFAGVPWLKVRSGTVAAPVAQTGGPLDVTIISRNV